MERNVSENRLVVRCPRCGNLVNICEILRQESPTHTYVFSRYVIVRCPRCGYIFEPITEHYIYEAEKYIPNNRSSNSSNNSNSTILRDSRYIEEISKN